MNLNLYLAERSDAEKWDQIVHDSPHGTIFHSWNWLEIAEKQSGFCLHPLMGLYGDEVVGVMPLFHKEVYGMSVVISPLPHRGLLYLGPVLRLADYRQQSKKEEIYASFINAINQYITEELQARYVLISLPPKLSDPRPFTWSGYTVAPNYNYETDVSIGAENLFLSLPKKKRQDIRRADKKSITVEIGGEKELESVYHLMERRYWEQGRSVQVPLDYLFEIYDTFSDNIKIFVAKQNDEIVTGLIDILYKDSLFSWIGNPKPPHKISPSPNDLLIWEEVQFCCNNNLSSYITMGTAGNERLHSYYSSKFNPRLDVRFSAKKSTFYAGCIESGYQHLYKPLVSGFRRKNG